MVEIEVLDRIEAFHTGWNDWKSRAILEIIAELKRLRAENLALHEENKRACAKWREWRARWAEDAVTLRMENVALLQENKLLAGGGDD